MFKLHKHFSNVSQLSINMNTLPNISDYDKAITQKKKKTSMLSLVSSSQKGHLDSEVNS